MYSNETQTRIRYAETDQMGFLYYGNYAMFHEVGRVEWIRSLGLTYRDMEEKYGIWMPVVSMQMRFVRPAIYDELIIIRTTLRELPEQFITFHTEIFNEKKKLSNAGTVRLCFMDSKTKKTITAPEYLIEALKPYF